MKSIDEPIRQAILEDNNGRPPDDFVESAEGGGLDADMLAKESPADELALSQYLRDELVEINPDVLENGELRYD